MHPLEIPEYIFGYALTQVVSVFYNRYPNSFAKHVISEDVLSREITDQKIITRKLIVKEGSGFLQKVPRWMSRLTKVQFMPTLEESVFDRKAGTLITKTRNVSWTRTLSMVEDCVYKKMDDNRTVVNRTLFVKAHYCSVFCGAVEKQLMKMFKNSTSKTLEGYNEKLAQQFWQPNTKLRSS